MIQTRICLVCLSPFLLFVSELLLRIIDVNHDLCSTPRSEYMKHDVT